jgi:hypothetical protein
LVADKFAVCPPWRKPTKDDEPAKVESREDAIIEKFRHILHTRLAETLPGLSATDQMVQRELITAELNAAYLREYNATFKAAS